MFGPNGQNRASPYNMNTLVNKLVMKKTKLINWKHGVYYYKIHCMFPG